MLHIFRNGQLASPLLSECLAMMGDDDYLLLIEDGVYQMQVANLALSPFVMRQQVGILTDDLSARALMISPHYQPISFDQWVTLSADHLSNMTWT